MPFGFNDSTQEFFPRVKYDAKSGRCFRVDRKQTEAGWQTVETDITSGLTFMLAPHLPRKGWVRFDIYSERTVPVFGELPPKPLDKDLDGNLIWKPTVKIIIKLAPDFGGDIRELGTSAYSVMNPIEELLKKIESDPQRQVVEAPIVKMTATVPVRGKFGTNYVPTFEIVGWKTMPEELANLTVASFTRAEEEDSDAHDIPLGEPPPELDGLPNNDDDLPF